MLPLKHLKQEAPLRISTLRLLQDPGARADHFRTPPGKILLGPTVNDHVAHTLMAVGLPDCHQQWQADQSAGSSRALLVLISVLTTLFSDAVSLATLEMRMLGQN